MLPKPRQTSRIEISPEVSRGCAYLVDCSTVQSASPAQVVDGCMRFGAALYQPLRSSGTMMHSCQPSGLPAILHGCQRMEFTIHIIKHTLSLVVSCAIRRQQLEAFFRLLCSSLPTQTSPPQIQQGHSLSYLSGPRECPLFSRQHHTPSIHHTHPPLFNHHTIPQTVRITPSHCFHDCLIHPASNS